MEGRLSESAGTEFFFEPPLILTEGTDPVLDRFPVPADVHSVCAEALGKVLEGERPEVRDEPIHRSRPSKFSKGELRLLCDRLDDAGANIVHVPVLNERSEELMEVQDPRDAHGTQASGLAAGR